MDDKEFAEFSKQQAERRVPINELHEKIVAFWQEFYSHLYVLNFSQDNLPAEVMEEIKIQAGVKEVHLRTTPFMLDPRKPAGPQVKAFVQEVLKLVEEQRMGGRFALIPHPDPVVSYLLGASFVSINMDIEEDWMEGNTEESPIAPGRMIWLTKIRLNGKVKTILGGIEG